MDIELLQVENKKKWDEFVNQHSEGRFVHLTVYKDILEKTYGYEGHFLYIQDQEEILSIFPFFEFKSFFKKKFASQPFSEYGGILIKESLTQKQKEKIMQLWSETHGQFKRVRGKIAVLKIDSYQNLYNRFDYQIKKAINKAKRQGVRVFEESSLESTKNKFYPLYTYFCKKRHGSPPHSLDFFLNCYQYAPQNINIFFAECNQKVIAALWGSGAGKRIQINYNPSLEKYFSYRANDLLHSEFIKWAAQHNFKYFDFGPVRYEGQIRYKKKWGAEFLDYFSSKAITPQSKLVKVFSWLWKNFLPLRLANRLGPYIRKNLGV